MTSVFLSKSKYRELHNWKNLLEKAIKAKTKANLIPLSIFGEIYYYVAHDKRFTESTKANAQKTAIPDSRAKKPKNYNQKAKPVASQPIIAAFHQVCKD